MYTFFTIVTYHVFHMGKLCDSLHKRVLELKSEIVFLINLLYVREPGSEY